MRWRFVLLVTAIAVPAAAATLADFDGTYSGALTLKPGLDGPACADHDVKGLRVEKGQIQAGTEMPSLSGTITVKGLVDGHMHKADGGDLNFEGLAAINEYEAKMHIAASIVDDKAGCGWALYLLRD